MFNIHEENGKTKQKRFISLQLIHVITFKKSNEFLIINLSTYICT